MSSLRAQIRHLEVGDSDATAEDIARVAHDANRALQITQGDSVPSPPWDDAPEYQVRQAVAGVKELLTNPGLSAEQSHSMWCVRMWADGWVWGEVKDQELRTHPTLLPYAALPDGEQAKDRLFVAIVRALAPQRS